MVRVSDIMIGDSPLCQIIAGVSFVVLVFAYALISIAKKAENADRLQYPTLGQVQAASDEQIEWWIKHLPVSRSQRERDVIRLIMIRHLGTVDTDKLLEASNEEIDELIRKL